MTRGKKRMTNYIEDSWRYEQEKMAGKDKVTLEVDRMVTKKTRGCN